MEGPKRWMRSPSSDAAGASPAKTLALQARAKLTGPGRHSLPNLRLLILIAVVGGLSFLAGVAIISLRHEANRELQAEVELAQIQGDAEALRVVQRDAAAADRVGPRRKRALIAARQQVQGNVAELAALEDGDAGDPSSATIARRLADYLGTVSAEFGLISADRSRAARTVDMRRVRPAFAGLREAVVETERREVAEAERARESADLGTVASLVVAALILIGFLIGADRYQRRAAERRATELDWLAHHDGLTGLPNRRMLFADLDRGLEDVDLVSPLLVVMFDLDGFKLYNDTFGHSEGDLLLTRLGSRLQQTISDDGVAYRVGGDAFCIATRCDEPTRRTLIGRCASALRESGSGFEVQASYGHVVIPDEADEVEVALRRAEERLYEQKEGKRSEAIKVHTRDLVIEIMRERDPGLQEHLGDVSELAAKVGRRMGLADPAVEDLIRAAELHDIGKIAIPESILHKPAMLSGQERSFMLRHTLIGQRMLESVPALEGVARIVRSCHERHDGAGYPDGLRGQQVPLASRIIFVCDAFDAMTTDRPYQSAMSQEAALAELRAAAGTQFDPAVVEAFLTEFKASRRGASLRVAGAPTSLLTETAR